jgi:hypothetical protein
MEKTILIRIQRMTDGTESRVHYGPFKNDQETRWFRDRNKWPPEECQIRTLYAVE